MTKTRKQVGVIGVDTGLCWIGDPCHVLHADPAPEAVGRDWDEFCARLMHAGPRPAAQFWHGRRHHGLGVCVSTGYGDGSYPVYATFDEQGRVAEVRVEFIRERDVGGPAEG